MMNSDLEQSYNPLKESILVSIHALLNAHDEYDQATMYFLNRMVRAYHEYNRDGINTWRRRHDIDFLAAHHKVTKRAADLIRNGVRGYEQFHYEHMVPAGLLRKQLIEMPDKADFEAVRDVLDAGEVMLLTKKEANVLDGSPDKMYPLDDGRPDVPGVNMKSSGTMAERLAAIGAEIDPEYAGRRL